MLRTRRHPNPDGIIEDIRQSIAEIHEVQPAAVLLIKPGDIPKTSSGKIQRHGCRNAFLMEALEPLHKWRAVTSPDAGSSDPQHPRTAKAIESWLIAQTVTEAATGKPRAAVEQ